MRRKIICVLALLLPILVSAKEGSKHCKDMLDVLGIPQDNLALPVYRHANNVARVITAKIDTDYTSLLHKITDIAPDFNLGLSRHRMLYHWGFNENPEDSESLVKRVNEATRDEFARKRIWELIKDEQGNRNRAMMKIASLEFKQNSGFELIREEQNALASIMYNVHILGDYEVSSLAQTDGMVTMNAIIADTKRTFRQRLREPNMDIVREFSKHLDMAEGMPDIPKKASKVLELMKVYVPKIFHDNRRMRQIVYGEK